jgi:sugar lactone lactonase YvrE
MVSHVDRQTVYTASILEAVVCLKLSAKEIRVMWTNIFRKNVTKSKRGFVSLMMLIIAILLAGCGGETETPPAIESAPPAANSKPQILNDAIASLEAVAQTQTGTPLDASPDPDSNVVYFTVQGNGAGVYRVPAEGGAVTALLQGTPLTAPLGLAFGTNGQSLYVAESAVEMGLYVLPVNGDAPTLLPGTAELSPRVPEVVNRDGQDVIYFSGSTPEGQPAVFKVNATGGEPVAVFQGAPLVRPSGLAITSDDVVYVADHAGSASGLGSVFRIANGTIEAIATDLTTDEELVGIALTRDEGALLVSHLEPQEKTAQVLIINLATLEQGIFNKEIGANTGAGGVHRAHNTADFAWADSSDPGICARRPCGNVYFLQP